MAHADTFELNLSFLVTMTLPPNFGSNLLSSITFLVFLFLDFLDAVLCVIFRFLDEFLQDKASTCYCHNKKHNGGIDMVGGDGGLKSDLSESLYARKNFFREKMGFLGSSRKLENCEKKDCNGVGNGRVVNSWSDCGCESCLSWMRNGDDHKLHVVVEEPRGGTNPCRVKPPENVLFIHGFMCSSSFWKESVFQNLSAPVKQNYRLIAFDLLGFGRSPKPMESLYTIREHLEMIDKSVIEPYELKSFHLVGHSMGCLIALAVAAKYAKSIKSITLVAPPYFPSTKDGASLDVLKQVAGKKLWPPSTFHASVMSWYEHLGRSLCFVICRHHRAWEKILKFIIGARDLPFWIKDITKHTHHSGWHNMHNVICGGAKFIDDYLETLNNSKVKICIIHGDSDQTVPLKCSLGIQTKIPDAQLNIIANATHSSVILCRKKDFTMSLEHFWSSIP